MCFDDILEEFGARWVEVGKLCCPIKITHKRVL